MNESTLVLYRLIQDRYSKVAWSHKIQECQGDHYINKLKIVKNHIVWFSILTTSGTLSALLPWVEDNQFISCITAFFATFLSYFTIRYNDGYLENKAAENKRMASELHDLRNKYESLLADIKANLLTDDEIVTKRNHLREEEYRIYKNAPYTSKKSVKQAGLDLIQNKESITEEHERESIIPDYLQDSIP